jgi:DNA (cytosine-5)-methyltransferase 1
VKVLDLFCGAGGAAMGLHRAWPEAEIIGVDINPQPHYPFTFIQADAMTFPLEGYDFIWASPPVADGLWRSLIEPLRRRLLLTPPETMYCIENVVGAPLVSPTRLCGSMFGLGIGTHQLRRHRLFEASFDCEQPSCRHDGPVVGIYGDHVRDRRRGQFSRLQNVELARRALGIEWMNWRELSEAIPPAYSEFIARQILIDKPKELVA